jgi:hypothetical protein
VRDTDAGPLDDLLGHWCGCGSTVVDMHASNWTRMVSLGFGLPET